MGRSLSLTASSMPVRRWRRASVQPGLLKGAKAPMRIGDCDGGVVMG